MDKFDLFWNIVGLCDWEKEGKDELVLMPVIDCLSSKEDRDIFDFDDAMSELLYALDTKELAKQCRKVNKYMSDDTFLYSRYVALVNGVEFYEKAKAGKCKEIWKLEFESLLYVPHAAWAKKHGKDESEYPHITSVSYETGSNMEGWK